VAPRPGAAATGSASRGPTSRDPPQPNDRSGRNLLRTAVGGSPPERAEAGVRAGRAAFLWNRSAFPPSQATAATGSIPGSRSACGPGPPVPGRARSHPAIGVSVTSCFVAGLAALRAPDVTRPSSAARHAEASIGSVHAGGSAPTNPAPHVEPTRAARGAGSAWRAEMLGAAEPYYGMHRTSTRGSTRPERRVSGYSNRLS
jgi:hypothetical protein